MEASFVPCLLATKYVIVPKTFKEKMIIKFC